MKEPRTTNEAIDEMLLALDDLEAAMEAYDVPATGSARLRLRRAADAYQRLRAEAEGRAPITWDDVEPAHRLLASALGNLDTILKRRGDLSEGAASRQDFVTLNNGVESALNHLTLLHNRAVIAEESEQSAHPLEAEQAGRIMQAAMAWVQRRSELPYGAYPAEESDELVAAVRAAIGDRTRPVDPLGLLSGAFAARKSVHFERESFAVCGADEDQRLTSVTSAVTCPGCREWLGLRGNLEALAQAARPRYSVERGATTGRYYVRDHQAGIVVDGDLEEADAKAERDRLNVIDRENRRRQTEATESGEEER